VKESTNDLAPSIDDQVEVGMGGVVVETSDEQTLSIPLYELTAK
jgi:hypothetical protein